MAKVGGEYRLVSEEDWRNLRDALDHEHRLREMESEASRYWQRRAEDAEAAREASDREANRMERGLGLDSSAWTYSDDPAGFNECRRDEPEPKGRWTSDHEWESEPETCDGCAGCSCGESDRDRRIANAVADELMERLRAFVL